MPTGHLSELNVLAQHASVGDIESVIYLSSLMRSGMERGCSNTDGQVVMGAFFFFQAEDGIRDYKVTGVQTCALPIYFSPEKTINRERDVAELKRESGVSKALNAAWVRPFLFLLFIVVAWDLTIRLFQIPAYQIPAPGDVVAVLRTEWPELLRQAWPTTYATICGFLLSALFGIPVAMLIAGSKTVESYVYPLLVFSQSVPKMPIAPLSVDC